MIIKRKTNSFWISLLLSATILHAADKTWDGGGSDDRWLTAANWDANTLPATVDRVFLDEPNGIVLIEAGDTVSCNRILGPCRSIATMTMIISGGTLTNPSYWKVGTGAGGEGLVMIQAGTITVRDFFVGANGGTATVTMTGGTFNITGTSSTTGLILPGDAASSGTFSISAGTVTCGYLTMLSGGLLDIGTNGQVRLSGDVRSAVQTYIANGYIQADSGNAAVVVIYDGIYTILLSSDNPSVPMANNPLPCHDATAVAVVGTVLNWQSSSLITQHNVYFGQDPDFLPLVSERQSTTAYSPGYLDYNRDYYWRVDEIQNDTVITGIVWRFHTNDRIPLESFESYSDVNSLRGIWKDGSLDNSSGSSIDVSITTVYEGIQSCQIDYDNTGAVGGKYYSEIETVPSVNDFTVNHIKAIDIWYNGIGGNSLESVYLTLSDGINTATISGTATTQTRSVWTVWRIAISDIAMANPILNLQAITKMCLGIGNKNTASPGGRGTVYLDHIDLWPSRCLTQYLSDLNKDCYVDIQDILELADQWLRDGSNEKVMDTADAGFSQTGFTMVADAAAWSKKVAVSSGSAAAPCQVRYTPDLSGRYDVYLYWRDYNDKDVSVNWTVGHVGGVTTQPFNQFDNPGWHFHGTYELDSDSYIELKGTAKQDAQIVADAVKFIPAAARVIQRIAKDTLTPVELNIGDKLRFTLHNGQIREVTLLATEAHVIDYPVYSFSAVLDIDGQNYTFTRFVPTQDSFYEPLEVNGMRLWLDAISDIFKDDGGWMAEKDTSVFLACRPKRKARLVVNDALDRICPDSIFWWYPETRPQIDVATCYDGNDTWLGPYNWSSLAHGGLDINMTNGTPLYAPIRVDEQYLFDSLAAGDDNNRWRGIRRWSNGSIWWLQAHHLNTMLVPEHQPLERGVNYALTAGVKVGGIPHTHFVFRVFEDGDAYFLDPWIFFWQTYRDNLVSGQ